MGIGHSLGRLVLLVWLPVAVEMPPKIDPIHFAFFQRLPPRTARVLDYEPHAAPSSPTVRTLPTPLVTTQPHAKVPVDGLSGPQTKIVNALQFWCSMGQDTATRWPVSPATVARLIHRGGKGN
jgi:hypothetical protein